MPSPHTSRSNGDNDKSSNRKRASIRNRDASRVNKPSARDTRASGQMVLFPKNLIEVKLLYTQANNCHFQIPEPRNSTSNTILVTLARPSRLSEDTLSEISQDDSVISESSTRVSNPRVVTRQPIAPPDNSNDEYYDESQLTRVTEDSPVGQQIRKRNWDLNGTHTLTPREQREYKSSKANRARTLRQEEISRRRTAIRRPELEPIQNNLDILQAREQRTAHDSRHPRPKTTAPQPLSAAVMASLAAEKAKFEEEELAAKRQYMNEHNGGGWDVEDYEEVGLRGGYSGKGAVTPTSSSVLSSQSRTDDESTASDDFPVEAAVPTMTPASRSVEAVPSRLASQPPLEHGDAPTDFDDSDMSDAVESVTPPSHRPALTVERLGGSKGKAVAMDEDEDEESCEESSEVATEDPAEDPTSDDDIADHYQVSTHTNGQSNFASSSNGPIEKEARKMPPGHIAIGEETHSRDQILVGTPQPEALTITIRTEKRDEHDVVIARAIITHKYTKGISWTDAKDVKCLNKWRSQILVRAFKAKHERRWKYTLSEMNVLCHFLEIQLAAPGVGGLMANVDWAWITTEYNDHFRGKIQSAGELYASASHTGDDGKKTSAAGQPMKDDRDAPFRSEIALKNQIYHFRDQRAVDLVRRSRDAKWYDGLQEPAGDKPKEDAENVAPTLPSGGSSPISKGPLRKLIFTLGNGSKVTLENKKRTNTELQTDEEMGPPNKKTKTNGPSHLRGGGGNIWEGSESNFDYSDDAAPLTHYRDSQLRSDSLFRQGSPAQTAEAFSNAQRALGQGRRAGGVNDRSMTARSTSPVRNQQRSREIENYDDESDDEITSSSQKTTVSRHIPEDIQIQRTSPQIRPTVPAVRPPPVDVSGPRPRPSSRRPRGSIAPQRRLLPAQHGLPQPFSSSDGKKRSRDDHPTDMVTRTLGQTGPRLPTLDDYFAED
ncbi:hypothetical protein BOTCAL_0686g00030 [Botryotinia calthae]|uniref:Uncharacterized protein n=1 Tax=Botryotinia calthae TaxID=38488 RepID=A0A4Y8CH91_9HELO|nr:hypothetical protein BOTCAL_0686g00030 [Botryotinia calthae]